MLFEREPEVSELPASDFVKPTDRMREGNEPAAEIDGICRGNFPILAPVAVEDFLGDIGMDQGAQRGQAGERDAHLHRHPDSCDQFAPPGCDGRWLAGPDALSGLVAADAVEVSQISFDVGAKPPGNRPTLDLRRPSPAVRRDAAAASLDIADAGIPQAAPEFAGLRHRWHGRRARTVIDVAIDNRLIDRLGFDMKPEQNRINGSNR